MSALGQKRTFDLFNNFVGDLVETQRHFEAKRLCGLIFMTIANFTGPWTGSCLRSVDSEGSRRVTESGSVPGRVSYRSGSVTKPNESDSRRASRIANELDELSCHRSP